MADLTKDDVLKLARLARLRLKPEEVTQFQQQISEILKYVEILRQADTIGLKPTYQVTGLENVMRKDEAVNYGSTPEDLLSNAPMQEDGYIKTKRIL